MRSPHFPAISQRSRQHNMASYGGWAFESKAYDENFDVHSFLEVYEYFGSCSESQSMPKEKIEAPLPLVQVAEQITGFSPVPQPSKLLFFYSFYSIMPMPDIFHESKHPLVF